MENSSQDQNFDQDVAQLEGERRLDLLESRYELYQRQASLLLRISLATLGIIVTFGKDTIFTSWDRLVENLSLSEVALQLTTGSASVSEFTATILVICLSIVGFFGGVIMISGALTAVIAAGWVIYPNDDDLVFGTNQIGSFYERSGLSTSQPDYRYDGVFYDKKQTVAKTRTHLQWSYKSAAIAVCGGIALVTSIAVFAFRDPDITRTFGIVSVTVILAAVVYLATYVRRSGTRSPLTEFTRESDLSLILASIVVWIVLNQPELTGPIIFGFPAIAYPLLIPPVYFGIRRSEYELVVLSLKSGGYFMAIFGLLGVFVTSYPGDPSIILTPVLLQWLVFVPLYSGIFMTELLAFAILKLGVGAVRSRMSQI